MYNLKHLLGVAKSGLGDMLPALHLAFNDDRTDDNLDAVFGAQPRNRIIALTIAGIVLGEIVTWLFPAVLIDNYIINRYVNWSAVIIGMGFAILFRRYLFGTDQAKVEDFPWLAASLIPAALIIAVLAFLRQFFDGSVDFLSDAPWFTGIGGILIALANALGVIAALTIAVAALCFSKDWFRALVDLAVQLLIFKIMVWVTVLVVVDIGIVGPILAGVIEGVFGIRFPGWLADFADQLTLAGLLITAYGAIIGAVWILCKNEFGALLENGDVRILSRLSAMAKAPKKPKKPKKPKEPKKPKKESGTS